MSGYLRAQRDRFKHPLFRNEKFCRGYAWDWMCAKARFAPTEYDVRGTTIVVERGQFVASPDEMATAWNWSRSAVNRFLTRLKSEHMIEHKTGHKKTLITICNYEEYQSGEAPPGHKTGHKTGHKSDTNRTVKNKGKEGKEGKEKVIGRAQDADAVAILGNVLPLDLARDFAAHRRELRKPLTERAATAMVAKLDGHPDAAGVVTDSIANGWQGIFPDKYRGKIQNGGHHEHPRPYRGSDPALEQIARLTGLAEASGNGGG